MSVSSTQRFSPVEMPMLPPSIRGTSAASSPFQDMLLRAVNDTSSLEQQSHTTILDNLQGGDITMAESVIAMREADLAVRLMMQVQRKLVDAWNELRNMQM